jgi:cysteinyl-tRNA synthetase
VRRLDSLKEMSPRSAARTPTPTTSWMAPHVAAYATMREGDTQLASSMVATKPVAPGPPISELPAGRSGAGGRLPPCAARGDRGPCMARGNAVAPAIAQTGTRAARRRASPSVTSKETSRRFETRLTSKVANRSVTRSSKGARAMLSARTRGCALRTLRQCALSRDRCFRAMAHVPTVRNSLTGEREPLMYVEAAATPPVQKWYVCGPTVYDAAHLGHARTYVTLDLMRRAAEAWLVRAPILYAMGATDIDAKIVARAAERGEPPRQLARRWEASFFADMAALNVQPPVVATRVTDHIPAIIAYVEGILRAGLAYVAADGVYFHVAAMGTRYGKMKPANHGAGDHDGGGSPAEETATVKRDPRDFALWKLAKPGDGPPPPDGAAWPSPWGLGWPGWHIECSAMTHAVLGPRLDLHAGGIDLAYPHHCNEVAQCEAYHGIGVDAHGHAGGAAAPPTRWSRLFLHVGHLHIAGRKMSKSLKNFISVADLLQATAATPPGGQSGMVGASGDAGGGGVDECGAANRTWAIADAFRLYCMQHHYAATLQYSHGACGEGLG